MSDIERIWITDAVKAGDAALKLRVLGGPYGVDKQGHEFHAGTDFADLPTVPVISYHGWDATDGKRIGWAAKAERDSAGQWYEVALDDTAMGRRLYDDAKAGKVRASSDAIAHLVRPADALKGYRGKIERWPIGAISLMGADTYERAINPRAVALPALKAFYDELITSLEANSDSGESAAKAGAVFAGRNASRIKQLKALIDELTAEMPEAFQESDSQTAPQVQSFITDTSDVSAGGGDGAKAEMEQAELLKQIESIVDLRVTAAAKAADEKARADAEAATEKGKTEAALKAQVDAALEAKLKEYDEQAAKAGRPKFFSDGKTAAKADDAAKAEKDAFERYYRFGHRDWTETPAAKAAMNEGTASQGGYLVPTLYNNEVVQTVKEGSILRLAGARAIAISGTTSFRTPTLSNTAKAVLTAEAGAFDEVEPTLGEVAHVPYKYTRLVKASDELLADSRIDAFGQIIAPDAANAFVLAENDAFTVGTGSSQPQGAVVGASAGVTAAGATAITTDELMDLYYALSYVYRPTAKWMMNDATLKYLRKLKDSTNQYLIQPGLNGDPLPSLMGRPVVTNNSMDTIATGKKTILFGDFSYFWIADFAQIEFRRLDELYAANGQVGFRWFKRFDSHVMLSAAIKYLVQA